MNTVEVSERGAQQLAGGSLWIFSNEIKSKLKDYKQGEWVEFYSKKNFLGAGYINPHSLIAGRLCSREAIDDLKDYFSIKINEALNKREYLKNAGSFRLLYSESDETPGLIVDLYETNVKHKVLVAQSTTAGMDEVKKEWIASLLEEIKPESFVIKSESSIRHLEGLKPFKEVVEGDESILKHSSLREYDTYFAADFINGQKTGFFLDQKVNRQFLKYICKDKSILDLCCYSGGWGITALMGEASEVHFVDQSKEALELVKQGLELNKINKLCQFTERDVFDFLEKDNQKYDIVVADPPAFVKSKKNLPQAMKAYEKLNTLALKRLKPGGLLISCSCSFHISDQDFEEIVLNSIRKTRKEGQILYRGTQSLIDHPWVLNRPESKYLKCFAIKLNNAP